MRKDYVTALRFMRPLAEQGNAGAQFTLGGMYLLGNGVPPDYVMGYMWLNLAAAQGVNSAIKLRDKLAYKLTPAQIAEAQRLALEWKPKFWSVIWIRDLLAACRIVCFLSSRAWIRSGMALVAPTAPSCLTAF